jgi:hypothetical protein
MDIDVALFGAIGSALLFVLAILIIPAFVSFKKGTPILLLLLQNFGQPTTAQALRGR